MLFLLCQGLHKIVTKILHCLPLIEHRRISANHSGSSARAYRLMYFWDAPLLGLPRASNIIAMQTRPAKQVSWCDPSKYFWNLRLHLTSPELAPPHSEINDGKDKQSRMSSKRLASQRHSIHSRYIKFDPRSYAVILLRLEIVLSSSCIDVRDDCLSVSAYSLLSRLAFCKIRKDFEAVYLQRFEHR